VLIAPDAVDVASLPHRRSLNVALLGVLSRHLPFSPALWHEAIGKNVKPELVEANLRAFDLGRGRDASS
jgi:indolepyruvate ferredoxin oxidoreductase beta subunit